MNAAINIPIDGDFEQVMISAVRYALGRTTYIVKNVCDYTRRLLPHLSDITLSVMERDIMLQEMFGYGHNQDEKEWFQLLNDIQEELYINRV